MSKEIESITAGDREIFANTSLPFGIFSPAGFIVYANPALQRLMKATSGEKTQYVDPFLQNPLVTNQKRDIFVSAGRRERGFRSLEWPSLTVAGGKKIEIHPRVVRNSENSIIGYRVVVLDKSTLYEAPMAQLPSELEEALWFQRIQHETTRRLVEITSEEDILNAILYSLEQALPLTTANIMFLDTYGKLYFSQSSRGYREKNKPLPTTPLDITIDAETFQQMTRTRRGMVIPDTQKSAMWIKHPSRAWVRSWVAAPLVADGKLQGFLNANRNGKSPPFIEADITIIENFADLAGPTVKKARLFQETQNLARMDDLTGLYNRRYTMELGERLLAEALRYNYPLSAMFFDIDDFRAFNNRYSHDIGDDILKALAGRLLSAGVAFRIVDIIGRYGGEEFLIILPNTSASTAQKAAERLLDSLKTTPLPTGIGPLSTTVSIGIRGLDLLLRGTPGVRASAALAQIIHDADVAMYAAKKQGKSRIVQWSEGVASQYEASFNASQYASPVPPET